MEKSDPPIFLVRKILRGEMGSHGCYRWANGNMLMWGKMKDTDHIVFPSAFPNACKEVFAYGKNNNYVAQYIGTNDGFNPQAPIMIIQRETTQPEDILYFATGN